MLTIVLYIVAVILLVLAAFGAPSRVSLGWLGLAVFVFVFALLPRLT